MFHHLETAVLSGIQGSGNSTCYASRFGSFALGAVAYAALLEAI